MRSLLLETNEPVVTSELARIEFASAVMAATRAGRLPTPRHLLDRFDADCADGGPIALLRLRPDVVLNTTFDLVVDHRLRTLDAIHLAVALIECPPLLAGAEMAFVTRDLAQADAARALGLLVQ